MHVRTEMGWRCVGFVSIKQSISHGSKLEIQKPFLIYIASFPNVIYLQTVCVLYAVVTVVYSCIWYL